MTQQQQLLLLNALEGPISPRSWQSFVEGRKLEPSLLVQLLTFRYALSERTEIDKTIRVIYSLEEELAYYRELQTQPPSKPTGLYSFHVLVHRYAVSDVTTLIGVVKQQQQQQQQWQNELYVFTNLEHHETMESVPLGMHFVLNNHYAYHIDNGLFLLHFLAFFFYERDVSNEPFLVLFESDKVRGTPYELANALIYHFAVPLEIETRLLELYKEITELVEQEAENQQKELESLKQQFYALIEYANTAQADSLSSRTKNSEAETFLALREEPEESIPTSAKSANELFIELLSFIRYRRRVTMIEQLTEEEEDKLRVNGENYTSEEVAQQILYLAYRLVAHIDAFNMPVITREYTEELGFTMANYHQLVTSYSLPFPILEAFIRQDTRSPGAIVDATSRKESLLMSPLDTLSHDKPEALRLLNFLFMRSVSKEQAEPVEYLSLLVLEKKSDTIAAYTLYTPALNSDEMIEQAEKADSIARRYNFTVFRTQIESQTNLVMQDYLFSGWYALFIVHDLMAALNAPDRPTDIDWHDLIPVIIKRITPSKMLAMIRRVLRFTQLQVLTLFFRLPVFIELSSDEEEIATGPVDSLSVHSSLRDLAILEMHDEFISDNIIVDMIRLSRYASDCHIIDPTYWAGIVTEEETKASGTQRVRKPLPEFKRPEIRRILMPLNQNNNHWALAFIDLENKRVSYYSSIEKDPYYQTTFKRFIVEFLKQQQPGIQYRVARLTGPIQSCGSVDCALFLLDQMQRLCPAETLTKEEEMTPLTRTEVSRRIREAITLAPHNNKVAKIERQFCLDYFSPPDIGWPSLSRSAKRFALYQQHYRAVIRLLLESFDLYEEDSIRELLTAIKEMEKCEEKHSLFSEILRPKKSKRPLEKEELDERRIVRKCLQTFTLTQEEEEGLRAYLQTLLSVKEIDEYRYPDDVKTQKQYFKRTYSGEIREFFETFIESASQRKRIVDTLIELLYTTNDTIDVETLFLYLQEQLSCYGRERVTRLVLKCYHCGAPTNQVSLSLKRAFCSLECLKK